jgi:hypothetical protein
MAGGRWRDALNSRRTSPMFALAPPSASTVTKKAALGTEVRPRNGRRRRAFGIEIHVKELAWVSGS